MQTAMTESLKQANRTFKNLSWKLRVSNPTMPKIYGLPKTHKPILKMRPIISNNNSPAEKCAKWLVTQFKNMKTRKFERYKLIRFHRQDKKRKIANDEILVSFVFQSNIHWNYFKIGLKKVENDETKRLTLIESTRTCVKYNAYQFENKFYKIRDGRVWALSLFIANLIMSNFEISLKTTNELMPRIWYRYIGEHKKR